MKSIQIIEPAGTAHQNSLMKNMMDLEREGFETHYSPLRIDAEWPYTSANRQARLAQLQQALMGNCDYVVAARGGYGVSDLLPLLDWDGLRKTNPKIVVGFSDITALQNALYFKLGWQSLHAPMPGSTLWGEHTDDIRSLLDMLRKNRPWQADIELELLSGSEQPVEGNMVGGCFSVLTNLIGTPYLEFSAREKILFLEDIGEHPARLLRFWNQWQQAGMTKDLQAVILGNLKDLSPNEDYTVVKKRLAQQMFDVSGVAVFSSEAFGHLSPHFPMGIGTKAKIKNQLLQWMAL